MNFKKWTTALMLALAVSSCIQDEALNSEAAIDACTGADVQLAHINSDSKEINICAQRSEFIETTTVVYIACRCDAQRRPTLSGRHNEYL